MIFLALKEYRGVSQRGFLDLKHYHITSDLSSSTYLQNALQLTDLFLDDC